MNRSIRSLALAIVATLALAGAASAQPISEPASCQGYLASYANPNYGVLMHLIVKPTADELGLTTGGLLSSIAQLHEGGLEPCIP